MPVRFQVVIDVADAAREVRFWSEALGYVLEPPPEGFSTWTEYWTRLGLPEEERSDSGDSIVDPTGAGPRIWFHVVPERKEGKNRLHFDLRVGGGIAVPIAVRRERVEAEARRLVALGAVRLETLEEPGLDHYAVAMADPEGNEFDIN